jgi:hypothetical protein
MQFKLISQDGASLTDYLKAKFQSEWPGWSEYAKKFAARLSIIQSNPRLEPEVEGEDLFSLNPPLLVRKSENASKMSCALLPTKDKEAEVTFAQQFESAHSVYGSTNQSKITIEQLVNFHKLLVMEMQYLAGCCTKWKNSGTGAGGAATLPISSGVGGGAPDPQAPHGSLSLLSLLSHVADDDSQRQDDEQVRVSQIAAVGPRTSSEGNSALNDIAKWDHRSGHFPLTESALDQMEFPEFPRPRYYYAAALILFMRASRTAKEEEVFVKLSERWPDWFGSVELDYAYLDKGAPQKGRDAYTAAESNWCSVRMQILSQEIKDPSDRTRLGLPAATQNGASKSVTGEAEKKRDSRRRVEQDALLDVDSDLDDSGKGQDGRRTAAAAAATDSSSQRKRGRKAAGAAIPSALPVAPAVSRSAPGRAPAATPSQAAGTSNAPSRKARTGRDKRPRPEAEAEALAVTSRHLTREMTGSDVESASCSGSTPISKRGRVTSDGRVVSKKDGRQMTSSNPLREVFKSGYRCPTNKKKWAGMDLDLGQAFKLAVWTHYGPHMPTDRHGNFEVRKALFRTAAYYSMSSDGLDEKQCIDSPHFPDFLYVLVQSAKQMRYLWLTEARIWFGDNVFTPHRAAQDYQRAFCVNCLLCTAAMRA